MEPRPPRPQRKGPLDRTAQAPGERGPAAGVGAGAAGRLYPTGRPGQRPEPGPELDLYGAAGGYGGPAAPAYGAEVPLVPRHQRRRRRLARAAALLLVLVAGLGAAGYYVADRLLDDDGDDGRAAVAPLATASPSVAAGVASPPAAPTTARSAASSLIATVTPTPASQTATAVADAAATEPEEAAAAPTRTPAAVAGEQPPLEELLPTEEEVGLGLSVSIEDTRTAEQVAEQLGGTAEVSQLLTEWGWSGNAFREFSDAAGALPPGSTSFASVSVHRFGSPAAADEALTYFSDYVVAIQGLTDFDVQPVGDRVRALVGAPEGLPLVVLYVQDGADLFRIGGSSNTADGDPTADVLQLARKVVAG